MATTPLVMLVSLYYGSIGGVNVTRITINASDLNTTLDTLTRVCRALHCEIGDLFAGRARLRRGR